MTDTRNNSAEDKPRGVAAYLDQTVWWKSLNGWILVADMSPEHRRNAAAWLLRQSFRWEDRAAWEEFRIFGNAPDCVVDEWLAEVSDRQEDPQRWARESKLYRALTEHMKPDGRIPDELMVRMGIDRNGG